MNTNTNITQNMPMMMTIRQVARTGIFPENALRVLVKNGEIPAVYSGCKAFINYNTVVAYLEKKTRIEA